jgi:hypothetical protein
MNMDKDSTVGTDLENALPREKTVEHVTACGVSVDDTEASIEGSQRVARARVATGVEVAAGLQGAQTAEEALEGAAVRVFPTRSGPLHLVVRHFGRNCS